MTNRVFMVRPCKDDVSASAEYGRLTFIYRGGDDKAPRLFTPEFAEEALRRLDDMQYDPEHDWLLITGDLASVVMIAAAVARDSVVPPRALFYDKTSSEYRPLRLGVPEPVDTKTGD